jgi:CubicO group peptidase (beta-lactamase class C family)
VTAELGHWQRRLDELSTQHKVPGASLAILDGGEVTAAASGVANMGTGVETTTDSVFQIGSITKVWTTTLLMQLADEGKLDLDAPLTDVLPELTLATSRATSRITTRHLVSHTSGIDGDVFDDFGRGDDCVARYVAACGRLPLTQPVGATMSYCNAGFVIAGRIVERLSGASWDAALRRGLIEPLGLQRTVTLPEEAIRFRAAYGHIDADGEQRLAPAWMLPGGAGPAGGIVASAGDVIAFAQLHLRGGLAADGTRLVSADSVAAMQRPEVEVPSYPHGDRHVGLGWQLHDWDGHRVIGHNGGTIGQYSFLHVLPDRDAAVCLLTNGGHHDRLFQDLAAEIFPALWQITPPARPEPATAAVAVDPDRYVGALRVRRHPA